MAYGKEKAFGYYIFGPVDGFVNSIQHKWTSPPCNTIKLNIDVSWARGKASMTILGRNINGEAVGFWYDNLSAHVFFVSEAIGHLNGYT